MTPMSTKLPTTSYALMGLLSVSSMSGYDLAQAADRSIANFWPVSRSQVYGELARLEGLGLVEGTDVAQERLPDKRVFEITPAGDAALEAWLAVPGYEPERMRLGFCVKMFFGHRMPRETLVTNLEHFRDTAQARAAYLGNIVELLGELPEAAYVRATALLGQRISETAAAWAADMLSSLPELEGSQTDKDHEQVHAKARELFKRAPDRT